MSRIRAVSAFGQQIWLDNLSRQLVSTGELTRLIDEDGVAGVTSNPAILFASLKKDPLYKEALEALKQTESDPERRYEKLAIADIQAACDAFLPLYESSQRDKGYVSLEVSPALSRDTAGTIAAAKRLWAEINRPNAMIKIPATTEGMAAISAAIEAGINVNVTLIFNQPQLNAVFDSYVDGLSKRAAAGLAIDHIRSVASFFISRVDSTVDPLLEGKKTSLEGKVALSAAKVAYASWQKRFLGESFAALEKQGGKPQLCLWASTGTKNLAYSDVLYVEQLIGADTVNTVPEATLKKFADHGEAASTLTSAMDEAHQVIQQIAELGINLDEIGEKLQNDGLKQFEDAFAELLQLVS
ncbi:transaldolase [Leeia sp. TBRC 13508]|uniref:Transaldolase n=1 Tax=Leeia speluncae TaxID=2884804 RepID=A0ABS8DA38_9NEIS|nr:transaldolase [Leeia speluncae]MCB6184997.1 transaldolase [Leeia speluncae]